MATAARLCLPLPPPPTVQALATTQQLTPADGYPDVTLPSGQWKLALPGKWVSGFFGGLLWQLHSLTGKQQWRELAQTWQAGLANRQRVGGGGSSRRHAAQLAGRNCTWVCCAAACRVCVAGLCQIFDVLSRGSGF